MGVLALWAENVEWVLINRKFQEQYRDLTSTIRRTGYRREWLAAWAAVSNVIMTSVFSKAKITAAVIFCTAAASMVWLSLSLPSGYNRPSLIPLIGSALALVIAAEGVFLRPRFSYFLALVSGLVALYWFWQIEFGYFPALNSWIAFNLPTEHFFSDVHVAKLKILFATTVVTATACSVIRLTPPGCIVRKIPLRERTWPSLAISIAVIMAWYAFSVSPYRIPLIVDGAAPELTILHVEKNGFQFHESAVAVQRDERFYVERNHRRLFQYQFTTYGGSEVLPKECKSGVLAVVNQLSDMRTAPPVALRKRNAEGWYVRTDHRLLAFTTEYGTEPPSEIVDLFHELQSALPGQKEMETVSDVCMGFCYDPLAGLGLSNMNDRCAGQDWPHCR